jgi:hypothetical protein
MHRTNGGSRRREAGLREREILLVPGPGRAALASIKDQASAPGTSTTKQLPAYPYVPVRGLIPSPAGYVPRCPAQSVTRRGLCTETSGGGCFLHWFPGIVLVSGAPGDASILVALHTSLSRPAPPHASSANVGAMTGIPGSYWAAPGHGDQPPAVGTGNGIGLTPRQHLRNKRLAARGTHLPTHQRSLSLLQRDGNPASVQVPRPANLPTSGLLLLDTAILTTTFQPAPHRN